MPYGNIFDFTSLSLLNMPHWRGIGTEQAETLTARLSPCKREISKITCVFSQCQRRLPPLQLLPFSFGFFSITPMCPKKSCLNSITQRPDTERPREDKLYELYLRGAVGLWKVVFCVFCLHVTIPLGQPLSPPLPRAALLQLGSKTASSPGV